VPQKFPLIFPIVERKLYPSFSFDSAGRSETGRAGPCQGPDGGDMRNFAKVLTAGLLGLALTGCAHDSYREEPHHFSKDSRGNRVACFATDVVDEYECVPAYRSTGYAYYDPFYDPFWGVGAVYYPAYGHVHAPSYPVRRPPGRWHAPRR
jgi:hypothetical protein